MTYSEKLKDPRWQKKRLEIFERDGFTCQMCSDKDKTLNVHHSKYGGDPWECPNEFLTTLCDDCHSKVEILKKSISLKISKPFFYEVFCQLDESLEAGGNPSEIEVGLILIRTPGCLKVLRMAPRCCGCGVARGVWRWRGSGKGNRGRMTHTLEFWGQVIPFISALTFCQKFLGGRKGGSVWRI